MGTQITILLIVLFCSTASAQLAGGWSKIKDPTNPEVQGIAKFAISEHNKQSGSHLVYLSVVSGESQVVAGTNYRLIIKAKDGSRTGLYEAVVWDKPWMGFRQLTSFKVKG